MSCYFHECHQLLQMQTGLGRSSLEPLKPATYSGSTIIYKASSIINYITVVYTTPMQRSADWTPTGISYGPVSIYVR